MKEAVGKEDAIISILDVLKKKPLFLNKVTSPVYAVLSTLNTKRQREFWLQQLQWDVVRNLFIEIKTAYYNSQDNSKRF